MKKISIILFITLFFISCNKKIEKPNIVFVFADQWRSESLGYAGNPDVKTPNIDQLAHYSYHIGQIVFLGRMIKGQSWISLSLPKGKSVEYNKAKFSKGKHKGHFTDDLITDLKKKQKRK